MTRDIGMALPEAKHRSAGDDPRRISPWVVATLIAVGGLALAIGLWTLLIWYGFDWRPMPTVGGDGTGRLFEGPAFCVIGEPCQGRPL